MVAIAKSRGVILAEEYEKLNSEFFSGFIQRNFDMLFSICTSDRRIPPSRLFIMDNDPSQTSGAAMRALANLDAELFRIPARSPDVNPIENIFQVAKKKLAQEAIDKHLKKESFQQFKDRVNRTLFDVDIKLIDGTINSMLRRIAKIIEAKDSGKKY